MNAVLNFERIYENRKEDLLNGVLADEKVLNETDARDMLAKIMQIMQSREPGMCCSDQQLRRADEVHDLIQSTVRAVIEKEFRL